MLVDKFSDSVGVMTHRPAVLKVKTLAEKLAIMDARRSSIHFHADRQR